MRKKRRMDLMQAIMKRISRAKATMTTKSISHGGEIIRLNCLRLGEGFLLWVAGLGVPRAMVAD